MDGPAQSQTEAATEHPWTNPPPLQSLASSQAGFIQEVTRQASLAVSLVNIGVIPNTPTWESWLKVYKYLVAEPDLAPTTDFGKRKKCARHVRAAFEDLKDPPPEFAQEMIKILEAAEFRPEPALTPCKEYELATKAIADIEAKLRGMPTQHLMLDAQIAELQGQKEALNQETARLDNYYEKA